MLIKKKKKTKINKKKLIPSFLIGLSKYGCQLGCKVGGDFDQGVDGPSDEEPGVAAHRPHHVLEGERGELPLPEHEGVPDYSQLEGPRQPQVESCA